MNFPKPSQRIAIIGKTGSGKTVAGAFMLSCANWREMPWIIIDYKRDKLLNQIPAVEIGLNDKLPTQPGVYIVHPMPDDDDAVEQFLWRIWAQENIGILFDEGYMISKSGAFQAIQTQGRSKRVPTIVLSQRPVWLSRFVFSEADFFMVFWLNDERDRKTLLSFLPKEADKRLPDYHSHYYDVGADKLHILKPVPS